MMFLRQLKLLTLLGAHQCRLKRFSFCQEHLNFLLPKCDTIHLASWRGKTKKIDVIKTKCNVYLRELNAERDGLNFWGFWLTFWGEGRFPPLFLCFSSNILSDQGEFRFSFDTVQGNLIYLNTKFNSLPLTSSRCWCMTFIWKLFQVI